ncbi:MAG: hypothetical protein H8F28_07530 [Fibrella sp.]|nr:hypothetical protein [Armatimonadota bacterium]
MISVQKKRCRFVTTGLAIRATISVGSLLLPSCVVAQAWQPVPLVTQSVKNAGNMGGEGGQWPQALAIDSSGSFLLFGTDVGGIFRSTDGGATWEPCNVGLDARGSSALAIDRTNGNRCFVVGANSGDSSFNGLYRSTNKGASWTRVVARDDAGYRDVRDQIAFDPTSKGTYDHLRTIYWAAGSKGLMKSTDGGGNWSQVNAGLGNAPIATAGNGNLFAALTTGVSRSTGGGGTFSTVLSGESFSITATGTNIWATRSDGVWKSTNTGNSWTKLGTTGLPTGFPIRNIKVSPADQNRILVVVDKGGYDKQIWYTTNNGGQWRQGAYNNANSFLPYNNRLQLFAWHPISATTAWSFGGDWITRTSDSGQNWQWAANGYNGILVGGAWNFSLSDSNLIFFAHQDYGGALSTNGGETWTYSNAGPNPWGDSNYGGYAYRYSDTGETVLWCGYGTGWTDPRQLKISRDGGATWFNADDANGNDVTFGGSADNGRDVSLVSPSAPWCLFAGNLRSADRGWHWSKMSGCDGVYTVSAGADKNLFGIKKTGTTSTDIVKSNDDGASWIKVATINDGEVRDIAYDHVRDRVYVVGKWSLFYYQNGTWTQCDTIDDQTGGESVRTVAVDPTNPAIVYIGSARDWMKTNVAVQRSTNAAAVGSWVNLTRTSPLAAGTKDGANEAVCIRVNPVTRYAWVSGGCYGMWKIAPP